MKIVKTLLAMSAAALILTVSAAEPAEDVRKTESEVAEKHGGGAPEKNGPAGDADVV